MAAAVEAAAAAGERGTTEELEAAAGDGLSLGALDITTEQLSLAGLEKEIEAFGDSEVLRAILDQGGQLGRGWPLAGGSSPPLPAATVRCGSMLAPMLPFLQVWTPVSTAGSMRPSCGLRRWPPSRTT